MDIRCGLLVDVAGRADYWACREEAQPAWCGGRGHGAESAGGTGAQGWGECYEGGW